MVDRSVFTLDGKNVTSIETFHNEATKILCPNFKNYGRNWHAFDDILRGGFGQFELNENITIVITSSKRIRKSMGIEFLDKLKKRIAEHDHIELIIE